MEDVNLYGTLAGALRRRDAARSHRLDRYRAGRCMGIDTATPETIAAAITKRSAARSTTGPSKPTGAAGAAARIAELL